MSMRFCLYFLLAILCGKGLSAQKTKLDSELSINELNTKPIGPNSVNMTWTLSDVGAILSYYALKCTLQSCEFDERFIEAPDNFYIVEGLKPNTDYTFELQGFGLFGNTKPASVPTKTCEGVPDEVTDVKVKPEGNKLNINWGKPKNPHGAIAEYNVMIWSPNKEPTSKLVPVLSYVSHELSPGLPYYVSIAAINKIINNHCGGQGKEVLNGLYYIQSTTPVPAPRSPVLTLYNRGVHMQWEPMSPKESVQIMAFQYELSLDKPEMSDVVQQGTLPNTATSVNLAGLNPFEDYKLTVNTVGIYSRNGVTKTFKTPPGIPDKVKDLKPTFTDSTLKVEWKAPEEKGGKLGNYRCTLYNGVIIEKQIEQETTSVSFTNLSPKTTYSVRVEASFKSEGNLGGGYGPAVTTGALSYGFPTKLGIPKLLSVDAIGSTVVKVVWEAPTDSVAYYQYKIIFSSETDNQSMLVFHRPFILVPGLKPSTTYTVSVKGVTFSQDGPESNSLTVKTEALGPVKPSS